MLRAESAIVISRCWLLAPGCLWLVLATSSAHAACPPGPGSSVSVSYHDTGQTDKVEVFDGQVPQDTDGRTRGITAAFEFGAALAPPSPWTATGVIRAFSDTSGFAETLLTDLLIENVGGPTSQITLEVEHCFDNQITIPIPFRASVDGMLLNTFAGHIREAHIFDYTARVHGEPLSGSFSETAIDQLGPVPFNHLLGPNSIVMLPPRTSQTHTFLFYLDSVGDAIVLENSALIEPASAGLPALSDRWFVAAVALLVAAGFGALAFRARV